MKERRRRAPVGAADIHIVALCLGIKRRLAEMPFANVRGEVTVLLEQLGKCHLLPRQIWLSFGLEQALVFRPPRTAPSCQMVISSRAGDFPVMIAARVGGAELARRHRLE